MPPMTSAEIRAASRSRSAADHPGTIRAFYPYWDAQYRPYLRMAVEALPPEHFAFKPRPEMLTAHQVVVHIAETERAWVHSVLDGGEDEEWVVTADDPAQGWRTLKDAPDQAALLALLEECHRPTQAWLDRPVADLSRRVTRRFPDRPEFTYTAHWILDHVQEHEIHHRAQLNLYLRLLGIAPPSI